MRTALIDRLERALCFLCEARLTFVLTAVLLVPALPPPAEARGAGMTPPEVHTPGDHHASTRRPRVLLDNYYNDEWRTDSSGVRVRYHYLWHDTTNSGFSILAGIIKGIGGSIDTLCRKPDERNLRVADLYIIVDPDTPQETEHPASMDSVAADAIARWVFRGGTLLLMGNDRGNADLAGLSLIGTRFGMRFNEDSRNRVVGKAFQTGTFSTFPPHRLFTNVRKVYLKEISTLALVPPAQPLLLDSGHVIIATARYGKGFVFAVGDPWFYDEYMDARKLPPEYDNAATARNLFQWLLQKRRVRQ
jgi:unsaturated rhamnogalacturonyl hydrolase